MVQQSVQMMAIFCIALVYFLSSTASASTEEITLTDSAANHPASNFDRNNMVSHFFYDIAISQIGKTVRPLH